MGGREVHEIVKVGTQKGGRELEENVLGEARGADGFRKWSRVPSAKRVKKDKVSVNGVREKRRKLREEMGVINCKSSRGPR